MTSTPITRYFAPIGGGQRDVMCEDRNQERSLGTVYSVEVDIEDIRRGKCVRGVEGRGGLRVGHLNINVFGERKAMGVIRRMKEWGLDVLILLDTRGTTGESVFTRKALVGLMTEVYGEDGSRVLDSPLVEKPKWLVGGQMALVAPRMVGTFMELRKCPMGLGVMMELRVKAGIGRLSIVSCYWPSSGRGDESLYKKVEKWMEGEGKVGSPNEWVRELAGRRVLKAQEEGVGVILIGDLNRDWGQLRPWAERFGLGDLTDGSGQTTTGAVRVDHILGWNTEVYNWGMDMGDTAIGSGNISDHRAMKELPRRPSKIPHQRQN